MTSFLNLSELQAPFSLFPKVFILEGGAAAKSAFHLHVRVRNNLLKKGKNFLLPKTESYFQALIQKKTDVLLGFAHKEKLAGIVSLVVFDNLFSAKKGGAIATPYFKESLVKQCGKAPVGVVQSFCVENLSKELKASKNLLGAVSSYAQKQKIENLFAQVPHKNKPSWGCFLKNDYVINASWHVPTKKFLLHCTV